MDSGTIPSKSKVVVKTHQPNIWTHRISLATYNISTYDTASFNSSELCCVCGGGVTYLLLDASPANSEGHTIPISQLRSYGYEEFVFGLHDTSEFTASECVLLVVVDKWYKIRGETVKNTFCTRGYWRRFHVGRSGSSSVMVVTYTANHIVGGHANSVLRRLRFHIKRNVLRVWRW